MRVRRAYLRYMENCAALGVDTTGWVLHFGRMSMRPKEREQWQIEAPGITPGIPDGVCGDTAESAAIRLWVATRTMADLVTLGFGKEAEKR